MHGLILLGNIFPVVLFLFQVGTLYLYSEVFRARVSYDAFRNYMAMGETSMDLDSSFNEAEEKRFHGEVD